MSLFRNNCADNKHFFLQNDLLEPGKDVGWMIVFSWIDGAIFD